MGGTQQRTPHRLHVHRDRGVAVGVVEGGVVGLVGPLPKQCVEHLRGHERRVRHRHTRSTSPSTKRTVGGVKIIPTQMGTFANTKKDMRNGTGITRPVSGWMTPSRTASNNTQPAISLSRKSVHANVAMPGHSPLRACHSCLSVVPGGASPALYSARSLSAFSSCLAVTNTMLLTVVPHNGPVNSRRQRHWTHRRTRAQVWLLK